ncbi:MAG TPA: hypothetical protein VFF11_08940 [Candidatus Binatia bacterium]|nr:hypothetical protein [Candidatus Binatia bacterium]
MAIKNMEARHPSAPLLSQIKSWQLVGLGISGWVTLYSVAIITWGAGSTLIGNTQGGCFAVTMTLAGLEARRFRKQGSPPPDDPLQWVNDFSTEQINQTISRAVAKQEFRVEPPHKIENATGFGVRAVNAGRTLVFETHRWKEPMIDLLHAQTTEENRRKVFADLAIIVGAGVVDEAARLFVRDHPLQLLIGEELKNLLDNENPPVKEKSDPPQPSAADASQKT